MINKLNKMVDKIADSRNEGLILAFLLICLIIVIILATIIVNLLMAYPMLGWILLAYGFYKLLTWTYAEYQKLEDGDDE